MKKLIVLIAVILIAGLLTGCWLFNQYPIITSKPICNARPGKVYVYDVEATDPDGDILIYYLTLSPNGMTIDPDTGVIEWIPNSTHTEFNGVTVEVSDGRKSAIQVFLIYAY